jgi:hypothetical protein
MIPRRLLLLSLVLAAAAQLPGCGFTEYQRVADRYDAARADLYSPAMLARLCAAGADTSECRR